VNNFKHIGKDFIPHDVVAKVTGTAKYAEDFRADGMVFCRLLTSPMPHARVKNIDAAAALKMEGVLGMLTADDIPAGPPGFAPSLAKEPMYVGEPILAVAALSEQAAEDAIAAIKIDYEPLPFTHDPLESLFPGGKDARGDGFNIGTLAGLPPATLKWTAADFGTATPIFTIASLNFCRSSALSMTSARAPIISTPYFFSAPEASSASAVFSAVWPPMVGSSASGRSLAMILATTSGVIGSI